MITFPFAKINLGLRIVSKRPDGYHDIETVFYPLQLCDVLEIIPNHSREANIFVTGRVPDGNPEENLCMRAWQFLHKELNIPGADIYLHKQIPAGAGLGGGSSDAAFTLSALNQIFSLNFSPEQLHIFASLLGSDCPFFFHSGPMLARGRGEILTSLPVHLGGYFLLLAVPPVHVSTKEAYARVSPRQPDMPLEDILQMGPEQWKNHLLNDFEPTVFHRYPVIQELKEKFYREGALYASISGSGAGVFGIFSASPSRLSFPEDYFIHFEELT